MALWMDTPCLCLEGQMNAGNSRQIVLNDGQCLSILWEVLPFHSMGGAAAQPTEWKKNRERQPVGLGPGSPRGDWIVQLDQQHLCSPSCVSLCCFFALGPCSSPLFLAFFPLICLLHSSFGSSKNSSQEADHSGPSDRRETIDPETKWKPT